MAEIEVETWCSKKRRMVLLLLSCEGEPKGSLVAGKPVACSDEGHCSKGELCYLNCLRLETNRKR